MRLQPLAQVLEDDIADGAGNDGDGKVSGGEDVEQGHAEALADAAFPVELPHQEVGVEEEDNECHLDDGPPEMGDEAAIFGVVGHGHSDGIDGRGTLPSHFLIVEHLRVWNDLIPLRREF